MARKKLQWHDNMKICPNAYKDPDCSIETHFAHWHPQSQDTLRRQRLGLCKSCWDKLKQSDEYGKVCEKMGWTA
jgi:hypothetical protein